MKAQKNLIGKGKSQPKKEYLLRKKLCRVLTCSSSLIVVLGSTFTIVYFLYWCLLDWVEQAVVAPLKLIVEINAMG
jgi:hypothetical protein